MTEKLKTLMDKTADREFAAPDLDAITAAGDRTVRRRRAAALVGGLAALALVGTGVAAVVGDGGPEDRRDRVAVAGGEAPVGVVTWTLDRTLHTPDAAYDLGHPVKAYVRTTAGYAFADDKGHVYSFVDGYVEQIGTISAKKPRLVSDTEDSLVGWVDPSGDRPAFVVKDLAGDFETTLGETSGGMGELADEEDPAYLYALDARTAYLRDDRGAVAIDVDSGEAEVIDADATNGFDINGVENGLIAFTGEEDDASAGELMIGATRTDAIAMQGSWSNEAVFSPDARWVSIDADEPMVYAVSTGERVAIDIDGRAFAAGFEWLDDDTLVMAASRRLVGPLELLTCEIPAGTCAQAVGDLGTFDELEGEIAVANGITTD